MKTKEQIKGQCLRIKRNAMRSLKAGEKKGVGQFRWAARRAWNAANDLFPENKDVDSSFYGDSR